MTHVISSTAASLADPRSAPTRLPFAWWNTRLAALQKKSSHDKQLHLDAVGEVVQMLIRQQGCALLGLTEVVGQNVFDWIPPERRADWDLITESTSGVRPFDVVMIFDRTRLSLMNAPQWVRTYHAGHRVRAGLVTTFGFTDSSDWLIVAAAHWPSDRGGARDANDRRVSAANALRAGIVANMGEVGPSAPILVMGDFNADPFEPPFGGGLPTARSRAEVQRHRPKNPDDLLLYNAAWRWLGEQHPWSVELPQPTLAGTYRQDDKHVPTVWRTFDQVLVSRSLLGSTSWSLDERFLDICQDPRVFDQAKSRPRAPFDHLPIVGQLQRSAPPPTSRVRQP